MRIIFMKTIVFVGLLSIVFLAPSTSNAQELKFAYMDFYRVFSETKQFQNMQQELESLRQKKQQELEQKRQSLLSEFEQFDVKRELMNQQAVQQRQQELMQDKQALMSQIQQEQINLNELKSKELNPLIDRLQNVVRSIAQEEGYLFIFKKVNLAYGDPNLDITDKVITRMNNQN